MPAKPLSARLVQACRALVPLRSGMAKPLHVLVCSIPNVGKSTLIDTLVRRKAAKTGDEAGITKAEQAITLASDATLFDNPGMLWPPITAVQSGFNLSASGAIGRNACDKQEVALALLECLQAHYPAAVATRYRLPAAAAGVAGVSALHADALLKAAPCQRGLVQAGARLNLQQAAEAVLNDFRSGALGRITLKAPAELVAWVATGEAQEAARQAGAGRQTPGCRRGRGTAVTNRGMGCCGTGLAQLGSGCAGVLFAPRCRVAEPFR